MSVDIALLCAKSLIPIIKWLSFPPESVLMQAEAERVRGWGGRVYGGVVGNQSF